MIYPRFIKCGDNIGVTAPSDGVVEKVDLYRLDCAIKKFKALGFNIIETDNVRNSVKGRSSTSVQRARKLEELFINDDVSSIICVAGGDFLVEMLSEFNFSVIKDNPKWIQGYSDPTSLLFIITTNYDIATIYSDNFKAFGMKKWHKSLNNNLEILKGNIIKQLSFDKYEKDRGERVVGDEEYNLSEDVCWLNLKGEKKVNVKGRIIGGCIDILTEIFGTRFDKTKEFIEKYKDDGIIWYFDNCELTSEALIRTLWKFRDNGWFNHTKAIIFGRSMIEASYYDISFIDAVKSSLEGLDIPIILNADIGHVSPRMTIINGAVATITSEAGKGAIEFELV